MADDISLLKAIAKQDMAALEQFYRRHENYVYRFALRKLNNEFDAADIVNTVMLEVWNSAKNFEERSKVTTWLLGIANFRIIDLLRKRKLVHQDEIAENIPDEDDAIDMQKVMVAAQQRKFIDDCLSALSGHHRQALELLFFHEATYEEMAAIMSCTLGTIKSRIYHAKQLLKRCLQHRIGRGE